jgi:hypothetical protein
MGVRGFCAYRLAQRLLDPVPAGNCKLQTLRQFYRLPERGAHTALGDVETVADLLHTVLRPLAEARQLSSWEAVQAFTEAEWYPSRIAFGKYKGRDFHDARTDSALLGWLNWLADSNNARSAAMGCWYLAQLAVEDQEPAIGDIPPAGDADVSDGGLVVFQQAEQRQLKQWIQAARERLAELEADYTQQRHAIDVTQARLFELLRVYYQRRDKLKLIVEYRVRFIETLLREGETEAEQVTEQYQEAQQQTDREYQDATEAAEQQRPLSEEEAAEMKTLWKKLVRLFQPDRFAHDPDKQQAYDQLMRLINTAKDQGDIDTLREIADDPQGFMARRHLGALDFSDSTELSQLRRLYDSLQTRILMTLEALNDLQLDPGYELHRLVTQNPAVLSEVAQAQVHTLTEEIQELQSQAQALADEIEALYGEVPVA